jgi:hypothetical protein
VSRLLTAKRRAQRGLGSGHALATLLLSGDVNPFCGPILVAAESVLRYSEKLAESRRREAGDAMTWTAVEFENWRSTVPDPEKRKRAWNDLSNDQKKEVKELRTFIGFCRAAEAQRAGSDIHGGSYSPLEPLGRMVFQKCAKQPTLNGIAADIVLHFSVSHMVPYPPMLTAFLADNVAAIKAALTASAFSRIWFYDEWSDKVLAVVERH